MANSMDGILVRYGVSLTQEEQNIISWDHFKADKRKRAAELKSKIKTVTIPEFLAIDPKNLSEIEQNIQRAIRLVYDLNGKDPPLYRKFPTFRSKTEPLTIDITTAGNNGENYAAAFGVHDNRVTFEAIDDPNVLILSLAHELKHAEQTDEESYKWYQRAIDGMHMNNAYAWHQLEFMNEAQAYITGARAYYEITGATENSRFWEVKTYANIVKKYGKSLSLNQLEEEAIKAELNENLLKGKLFAVYKDYYDATAPIGEQDKGLDCIPEALHLSPELLSEFQKVPRIARTINGKLLQAQKNKHVDEYIHLLQEGLDKGEDMPDASFKYVCMNGTLDQIQKALNFKKGDGYLFAANSINYALDAVAIQDRDISREISQYLLGIKRDGKSVIETDTIISGLKGHRTVEGLNRFIQNIQDGQGYLPITAKDCTMESGSNSLFRRTLLLDDHVENSLEMLSIVLKLKGSDGKFLVTEKQLVEKLCDWANSLKQPEHVKALFQKISDENGNLPFSRGMFDICNSEYKILDGQNSLLYQLSAYTEETKKSSLAKLPILMSLKDKDGQPIISQENIERFSKYGELAAEVKAYLQPKNGRVSKLQDFFKQNENQQKISADSTTKRATKTKLSDLQPDR